ncbi:aldehyde dehydrogenase family protein [Bacteroidota bacterium]
MVENYKIYVGGEFKKTDNVLTVLNPFDNSIIAETFLAGKKELDEAIIKGLEAEEKMKILPVFQKFKILMQISNELKNNRNKLAKILSCESCKPLKYALAEIDRSVQSFLVAAEESKRLPSEYLSIDWTPAGVGKEGLVKYFPLGLIAGIAPFNFPMNLAVHKIAPAIAAGNPIILKPARSTPLSVLELAKIIDKTELPKGAISILPMDRQSGNQLVTDPRFKMLTFTGSPDVGWKMKNEAGKKRVTLELGGNAGVIITESSDIDLAVKKCLTGGFAYSGQVCIHVQRIYVHKSIFDEFTEKYISKVNSLKKAMPESPETDISSMIDEENAKRVEEWVNEAIIDGAEILCGGNRENTYYEPTVLTNTNKKMKVNSSEVFGPVVCLEKYSDFTSAVNMVNDSKYGLQAGVFTNCIDEMNISFNDLDVGGVIINDVPTFRVDHMPYGGVKDSGNGREGLKYAIQEMMEPKLMIKNMR